MKRAPKNFSRKCRRRGEERKNNCNNIGHIKIISRKCWPRAGGGGGKINAIINQMQLKQKCKLINIFMNAKGILPPEKGHFWKLGGGGTWPPVPTPLLDGPARGLQQATLARSWIILAWLQLHLMIVWLTITILSSIKGTQTRLKYIWHWKITRIKDLNIK